MSSRSLPVFMPVVANQRWSCHSCGDCCRVLVGHLFDHDRERIDRQGWESELGVAPYVRVGPNWVLNKQPDGACVFLDGENRCRIHSKFGEAAKPLACRIFPFSVRPVGQGWRVSFRFDCPSAASSKGKPISQYGTWLKELIQRLEHTAVGDEDPADLQSGIRGTTQELDSVTDGFTRWLRDDSLSVWSRVVGAARLTSTLSLASLKTVRGPRFGELLQLLFDAAERESQDPIEDPTKRQRGLLRQLVLAHAEHVSIDEAIAGVWGRMGKRWQQLRNARRFLRGRGDVPSVPGFTRSTPVPFTVVEGEFAAGSDTQAIEELVARYLITRLQGRSCFGEGYYGWPVVPGLAALWLSVAAAGWLSRLHAASMNRGEILFEDFAYALGVVDRAATRLPAPGSWAERIRVSYLMKSDGIARLLRAYVPIRWDVEANDEDRVGETDRAHPAETGGDSGAD